MGVSRPSSVARKEERGEESKKEEEKGKEKKRVRSSTSQFRIELAEERNLIIFYLNKFILVLDF